MNDLEREKIDALAEFAAGVGHELNNPLAIIGGHAQQLLRDADPESESLRRSLATILAQVRRAYEMIADIRLFARPPQPEWSSFDPYEWLRDAVDAERPRMEERRIGFSFRWRNGPEPGRQWISDPLQLRIVLDILCKNAREALSRGNVAVLGELSHDESDRARLRITVEDDGPGIPEEIRPLIFCPYFSGRQAGRGLGFGLPKAFRILEQLGGAIHVEAVEPHGSRFIVTVPEREATS